MEINVVAHTHNIMLTEMRIIALRLYVISFPVVMLPFVPAYDTILVMCPMLPSVKAIK